MQNTVINESDQIQTLQFEALIIESKFWFSGSDYTNFGYSLLVEDNNKKLFQLNIDNQEFRLYDNTKYLVNSRILVIIRFRKKGLLRKKKIITSYSVEPINKPQITFVPLKIGQELDI